MLIFLLSFFLTLANAQDGPCDLAKDRTADDLRIFIITLSPGDKVWSSFGHTAIWVSDGRTNKDEVFNYGTFDGEQPNLLGRYLNGTLEYWLSVNSYQRDFRRYNKNEDRHFVASRLLLPPEKLEWIAQELNETRKPENRSYIYHWAKNSCATKIRDLINDAADNQLYLQNQSITKHSYRSESLRHLWLQPLTWLGWHYIANSLTDQPLSKWELMYSPVRFQEALKDTTIQFSNGKTLPLTPYQCNHEAGLDWAPESPPDYRSTVLAMGSSLGIIILLLGWFSNKKAWGRFFLGSLFIFIGTVTGLIGSVHAALFFSALEGLHPNLNQLLCSPLHFGWVWVGFQILKGQSKRAQRTSLFILSLGLLCLILALLPWVTQRNTELLMLFLPLYIGMTLSNRLYIGKSTTNELPDEQEVTE